MNVVLFSAIQNVQKSKDKGSLASDCSTSSFKYNRIFNFRDNKHTASNVHVYCIVLFGSILNELIET